MRFKILICFIALFLIADNELYNDFYMPCVETNLSKNCNNIFQLRRTAIALIAPDKTGTISIILESKQQGKRLTPVLFTIKDLDGNTIDSGVINEKYKLEYKKLEQCIWRLIINTNENSVIVKINAGRCSFETFPNTPLRLVKMTNKLYFFINSGHLKMSASGSTPNEHIAITIRDENNKIIFKRNSLNKSELKIPIDITIPSDQKGKIWSIQFERIKWYKFEDMWIAIESGASPMVALSPNQLIVPYFNKDDKILDSNYIYLENDNTKKQIEDLDSEDGKSSINNKNFTIDNVLNIIKNKKYDPHLPNVLVIGDSISTNYHNAVIKNLKGKFNYCTIAEASDSSNGIKKLPLWINSTNNSKFSWNVVVLNHGLHDLLQYTDKNTKEFVEKHKVDIDLYKKNIDEEFHFLTGTGAKIIWCMTTPVPHSHYVEGQYSRRKDEDIKYNTAAKEILQKYPNVIICDLNELVRTSTVFDKWRIGNNVHFYRGSEKRTLANALSETIIKAYYEK